MAGVPDLGRHFDLGRHDLVLAGVPDLGRHFDLGRHDLVLSGNTISALILQAPNLF